MGVIMIQKNKIVEDLIKLPKENECVEFHDLLK